MRNIKKGSLILLAILVIITAIPLSAFAADQTFVFSTATIGYVPQSASTSGNYTNMHNVVLTSSFSGRDAYAFTASPAHMTLNGSGPFTITIQPISGLEAGTYYALFTINAPGYLTLTTDIYFTVLDIFTVKFVDWDGAELETQSITQGSAAIAPHNPNRTGYTFIGWNKAFSNVQSDMIVEAVYDMNTYAVKFLDHDGVELNTESVAHGAAATAPSEPNSKENWHFSGWDTDFSCVTEDLTVTALYEINTYTVSFYKQSQDGNNKIATTPFATQQVTYNEFIDFTNISVGKNAVWYYTDGTTYGAKFDVNTPITGELKLAVKDQNNNQQ